MVKINNKFRLHPSILPTLILIKLISLNNSNNNNNISILILDEILELSLTFLFEDLRPNSLNLWLNRIKIIKPLEISNLLSDKIKNIILKIANEGIDGFNIWLNELKAICPWSDDEDSNVSVTPLHRASPFALYLRKSLLLLGKLTYDEAVHWWDGVIEWSESSWSEPDRRTLRKKMADAYAEAKLSQDYQAARDATSYYDIDDGTSGQSKPQYALLNTAFFEYESGGWSAAHQALAEAIQIARHVGDSRCLVSCASLSKRLFSSAPDLHSGAASASEVRLSPTDLLWDIKEAYSSGQSTISMIGTLYTARALYHHPPLTLLGKNKGRVLNWNDSVWDSAAQVISAFLWSELGFTSLAMIRESVCLSMLTQNSNNWNIQVAVLSARAKRLAEINGLDSGIRLMLASVSTSLQRIEMGFLEFRAWESALWNLIEMYAQKMQFQTVIDYLARATPPVPLHWTVSKSNHVSNSLSDVEIFWGDSKLDEAHTMIVRGDALHAMPLLLQYVGTSTLASKQSARLSCLCMIIECRLDLLSIETESRRGVVELESIWSQILSLQSPTLLAYAKEVKAKTILLINSNSDCILEEAVILLEDTCRDYDNLGLLSATVRIKKVLCLLYHKLSLQSSNTDNSWLDRRNSLVRSFNSVSGKEEQMMRLIGGLSSVIQGLKNTIGVKFEEQGL